MRPSTAPACCHTLAACENEKKQTLRCSPRVECQSPLGGLIKHVVCHILDVIGPKALAEGWHGALTIGDLIFDGLDIVATSEVLFERILLEFLLRHDAVVAPSMAGRAVAQKDTLTVLKICSQGRATTDHGGKEAQGHSNRQGAPSGAGRLGSCSRRLSSLSSDHGRVRLAR